MSVVCAGEILVDRWPDGTEFPGGAPANVACHASALGAESFLISRVGDDPSGRRLREWLRASGVTADFCTVDCGHPTGVVAVDNTGADGPRYDIPEMAAWDFIGADEAAVDRARRAGVFVFGTLAQRHPASRAAIRRLVEEAAGGGAWVMADLNLRAPYFDEEIVCWTIRHCRVLKLGRDELRSVSALLGATGSEKDLFPGLLREFGLSHGVLTAGSGGAWIYEDGKLSHEPAVAVEAVDTVGAGDAFGAALAVGLGRGQTLRESAPQAARTAAFVVAHRGATPPLPPELVDPRSGI